MLSHNSSRLNPEQPLFGGGVETFNYCLSISTLDWRRYCLCGGGLILRIPCLYVYIGAMGYLNLLGYFMGLISSKHLLFHFLNWRNRTNLERITYM